MATVSAIGAAPNPPLEGIVKGLFFEKFGQEDQAKLAVEIAPLTGMDQDSGEYAIERPQFLGLDLGIDPNALTPAALEATSYPSMELGFASKAFRLNRYLTNSIPISDRRIAQYRRGGDIDLEGHIAKLYRIKAEAVHTHQVLSAVSTAGNYDAALTYDPGNLSVDSFDLITAFNTLDNRFRQKSASTTAPLLLIASDLGISYLQKNLQVRNHPGAVNGNFIFDLDALSQIITSLARRPISVRNARNIYNNGTALVESWTAHTMAIVQAAPGMEASFLKTLHGPDGAMLDYRQQRCEALKGFETFGDVYYEIHQADQTAGVLWTGINA